MRVVEPEPRHPREPHRRQRPGQRIGGRQVGHQELQVDDVLGRQSRDRRRPDVLDRQAAGGGGDPGGQQGGEHGPAGIGIQQHCRPGSRRPPARRQVLPRRQQAFRPQVRHPLPEIVGRPVVVHPDVGERPPLLVGDLRSDAGPGIGLGEPAIGQPLDPGLLRRTDAHHEVVVGGQRQRAQQRNVVHHHAGRRSVTPPLELGPDQRVGDPLQPATGLRIRKDDRRPVPDRSSAPSGPRTCGTEWPR